MVPLREPARVTCARLPTPLERLERYSLGFEGVEVWIKRDDLTGCVLSGNKIRKLEYAFGVARERGATAVITCGGINSNHCRATAWFAARCGLRCYLLLRTNDGRPPAEYEGNTLLDVLAGARVSWITPEDYTHRDARMAAFAAERSNSGETVHVIPEGASDATGAWGYVRATREILEQCRPQGVQFDCVVHAIGSGGTTAGLLAGRQVYDAPWRVVAVPVCDDEATFRSRIAAIRHDMTSAGVPAPGAEEALDMLDGFQGRGYALTTPEELQFIRDLCVQEGILLDPCYTGKAMWALDHALRDGRLRGARRVLFLHTGGAFSNFSYSKEWNALLA